MLHTVIPNAFTIFFQGSNAEICVGIFYTVKWPENDNQILALRRKHFGCPKFMIYRVFLFFGNFRNFQKSVSNMMPRRLNL